MKEEINILANVYKKVLSAMLDIEKLQENTKYRTVKNCKMLIRVKNRLYKDSDLIYKVADMMGKGRL